MAVTREMPVNMQRFPAPMLAVPIILAVAAVAWVYSKAIDWWYHEWTYNGGYYAHAIFIPFFVAAMLWRDKERLRRLPIDRCWWGLIPVGIAAALVLFGYKGDVTATLSLSFMFFVLGGALITVGYKMWKALLFPLCFLMTVIPIIPNQLINVLAFPIQLSSAKLAATMLNVMQFEAVRSGTFINTANYSLNVETACSGFKTLLGLLSFAGAFAYLVDGAKWKRWFLFLIAGPLAILINGIRIMLIAIVGDLISGPAAMQFHDYSGFIVLILGFLFLFSLAKWIKCDKFMGIPLQDPTPAKKTEGEEAPAPDPLEQTRIREEEMLALDNRYGRPRAQTIPLLGVGFLPLLAVLGGMAFVKDHATTPLRPQRILQVSEVPESMVNGDWLKIGEDRPPDPKTVETLQPEIFVDRSYRGIKSRSGALNLLITGGRSRRTFHDPHECFMGGGYFLRDLPPQTIQTSVGPVTVQVSESEEMSSHKKQMLMFIFLVDGKVLTSISQVHMANLKKTFMGSNGMPFYFLRFRQLSDGNGPEQIKELETFIQDFWPIVKPIVTVDETK